MAEKDALELRFDPQTVDHLGARMYSHLPNALAELVANAYDADATVVTIQLSADGHVSVIDDGHGMSRADLSDKYLRIGRNRRISNESTLTESGTRRVSGKKGLGKLALFGIGSDIELRTTRADSDTAITLVMSYAKLMGAEGVYAPEERSESATPQSHGTTVILRNLKRKTPIDAGELAESLSRLFNYGDSTFSLTVVDQNGGAFDVTHDLRLQSIEQQFVWDFPSDFSPDGDRTLTAHGVSGRIASSRKPLRQALRGVTLYANGRLINEPEFFGASESSYAFSYLTGYLNVDFLDDTEADIIATDRRAIDWEQPEPSELRESLQSLLARISQEWRTRRSESRRHERERSRNRSTTAWIESIRTGEREAVARLVNGITSDELDLSESQESELLDAVEVLAPFHAEFVWRHLHEEIQSAARVHYERGDYFRALEESIKRYVSRTEGLANTGHVNAAAIMGTAYGKTGRIRVFAKYVSDFSATSADNVEDGQKHLSMGTVAGFRNLLAHEEVERLRDRGALTFQDCLDALSILSHLFRRLSDQQDPVGLDRHVQAAFTGS